MMNRPPQLTYALDERPPFFQWLLLGLQYACMMCPYLIIVVILNKAQGPPSSDPVSFSLIALAVATVLQALKKGPIGSGFMAPPVISAIYFPASLLAVSQGGLSLVYGMTMVAGFVEMGLSFFLNMLRKFFPPVVSGLIITAVGLQLGLLALSQIFYVEDLGAAHYSDRLLTSTVTLLTVIILTIWAKGIWRLLSPFFGIVAGFTFSFFLDRAPSLESAASAPWLALPDWKGIHHDFSTNLLLPFVIAAIASTLRVIGAITTCQRINNATWYEPNTQNIRKDVLADGVGCALGGFLGVPGFSVGPSLIGVSQATGATSRVIAYALAFWLVLFAFLPKFLYLFLSIPLSVMGAALLFTASFMVAGGIDLISSRKIDTRAILVIGISLLLGISKPAFPDFYSQLPTFLQMLTSSLLYIVTLSAVLLNVLFRIRVRQVITMDAKPESEDSLYPLIPEKLQEWSISKETTDRVIKSTHALIEQLKTGHLKKGNIRIDLVYDPVEIILKCSYQGTLPQINFTPQQDKPMIEEFPFVLGISSYFLEMSPNQIKTSTKDTQCFIELHFHI